MMKKILLLLITIQLCACASTKTFGYLDPDYQNNYKVTQVIVSFKGVGLDEVFQFENKIIQRLSVYNIKGIRYTAIIPPTKNYTDDEWGVKIKESGADALLTISIARDSVTSYVPQMYHSGSTTSTVNTVGNTSYVSTTTSPDYTTGGYQLSAPITFTMSSLIDIKNGNTVWKAETSGSGSEFSTFSELLELTFDDIITDMNDKGLFR